MSEKFWMVIREKDGCATARRHVTLGEAKVEAERLCAKERAAFFILEAIEKLEPERPPMVWRKI